MKSEPLYALLISLGAILNFQWMTSFAERSYTWPKWLPKMKALLTLILQCVHIKTNVFTLYQEEYFLYRTSVWVCCRNFKAFVQRYSWIDDIEGNWRADLNATKKMRIKLLATSSDKSLTSSQVIFLAMVLILFHFKCGPLLKKLKTISYYRS